MTVIESAVAWAIGTANNNAHGYSQANRWGNPDYDCSSFVITAYEQAGVHVKSHGNTNASSVQGAEAGQAVPVRRYLHPLYERTGEKNFRHGFSKNIRKFTWYQEKTS